MKPITVKDIKAYIKRTLKKRIKELLKEIKEEDSNAYKRYYLRIFLGISFLRLVEDKDLTPEAESYFTFNHNAYLGYDWVNGNNKLEKLTEEIKQELINKLFPINQTPEEIKG